MENETSQNEYEHNDGLGDLLKEREKLEFSWAKTSVVVGVLLSVIVLTGMFILKFGKDIVSKNQDIVSSSELEAPITTKKNDSAGSQIEISLKDNDEKKSSNYNTAKEKQLVSLNTSNVIKKRQQTSIQKKSKTYYKVITGTFKNKKYAENLITKLKKSGFDGFYKIKSSSTGSKLYRVQAGSFFRKSDAENYKKKLTTKKFQSYIIKE